MISALSLVLVTFAICLASDPCDAGIDNVLFSVSTDDSVHVVVSRRSTLTTRIADQETIDRVREAVEDGNLFVILEAGWDEIIDTVAIHRTDQPDQPTLMWTKSHGVPVAIFQRCTRLVLYDVMHDHGTFWVLYSAGDWAGCKVYLDQVVLGDDADYHVDQTHTLFSLSDSGFQPNLIETGLIFRYDDAIHIGFKTFGSSSSLRDRDHPYVFWVVVNDSASQVEDQRKVESFRIAVSHELENMDRPRMSEQTKPQGNAGLN